MPLPVGAEEFRDLLSLVMRVWRVLSEAAPATAALNPSHGASNSCQSAPVRSRISAATGENGLTTNGSGGSVRHMIAMPDTSHDTLSGRLNDAMISRGISPGSLARRAGYASSSANTIRRYAAGAVAAPRIEIVYRLADALGCDRLWLMFGRGEPNWNPPL